MPEVAADIPDRVPSKVFRAPKRESTVELVIRRVKTLLMDDLLKPGDRLPNEKELAAELNVSRGSVREAMKILAAFGVVTIQQGDGTYVARHTGHALFDPLLLNLLLTRRDKARLMELRELLEIGIERLIIKNADDLAHLEATHARMVREVESGNSDAAVMTECDLDFHRALGAATGNEFVRKIYEFVLDFLGPSIEETHVHEQSGSNAVRLHQDILDSLKARDPAWATIAIRRSIEHWVDRFSV